MNKINWYDQISASYGFKIQTEGERDAFYEEVRVATGAKNDEIVNAVRHASSNGLKPITLHGRVATSDVIWWIKRFRSHNRVENENNVDTIRSSFINTCVKKLRDGWDMAIIEDDAFYQAKDRQDYELIMKRIKAQVTPIAEER